MIYEVLNWTSGYIYGSILFFSFLYSKLIHKDKNLIPIFMACSISIQLTIGFIFSFDLVEKAYPFIAHIPLALFAILYLHKSITASLSAILIAYILMSPRNWLGDLFVFLFPSFSYMKDITKTIVTLPILLLLLFLLSPHIRKVLQKNTHLLQLIIIPGVLYYCIAYITTVYTNILYHSDLFVIELILILFTAAIFVYVWIVFQQISRTMILEQQQKLIRLQANETMKRMDEIRYTQEKTKILRHDLRHYFQILDSMILEGKLEEARKYIHTVNTEINDTMVRQYCANESINLILSSYAGKASKLGVNYSVTSNLTNQMDRQATSHNENQEMPIELDTCIVLANGIENALHAVLSAKDPWILIECNKFQDKIVIQIKNPCSVQPIFKNALPQSNKENHGMGTASILAIANKYGGIAEFTVEEDIFALKVIM